MHRKHKQWLTMVVLTDRGLGKDSPLQLLKKPESPRMMAAKT